MNTHQVPREIRMIPVDRIEVLNPRDRNALSFRGIVKNIEAVGLKKPVTVTPRPGTDGAERYMLICGEGRLKALRELGETSIPALISLVDDEDAYIMSLAENIARRRHSPLELLQGVSELQKKGYTPKQAAAKTGLSETYIQDIMMLLDKGEQRLIVAAESGRISLNAAKMIAKAGTDDKALQATMQEAYESGELRGRQLLYVRRLVERRQIAGRALGRAPARKHEPVTSSSLVRAYQKEVQRQQTMVRRWSIAQKRLSFITGALRTLLADENFVNVLQVEGLATMPTYLAERVHNGAAR